MNFALHSSLSLSRLAWRLAVLSTLALAARASGEVIISEFMASNVTTLTDGDGERSDWIELHNTGTTTVSLAGWYLTDSALNLKKSVLPAHPLTSLSAGQRLVIFASGVHFNAANVAVDPYFDAGGKLHTNFKLDAGGGYLALVHPNGVTKASEYASYPQQKDDVSWGYGTLKQLFAVTPAPVFSRVPADDSLGLTWTGAAFVPGAEWIQGTTGVGFDTDSNYTSLIRTDLQTVMFNHNASVYLRTLFTVADPARVKTLALRMQYDDGFIAYLNGVEVASRNRPLVTGDSATLPAVNLANGISWVNGYSVPNQEGGHLEIGVLDNRGVPFREGVLLRFDAAGLAGVTSPVLSVRLETTVELQYGGAGAGTGTVELYRVDPSQTNWTNNATVQEMDGNGAPPSGDAESIPWNNGADIFSVKTGPPLASATVDRLATPGTVYRWEITGPDAQQLIDDWRAGNNPGLTLVDTGATGGRDYRSNAWGFDGDETQRPRLIVTFSSTASVWNAAAAASRPDTQATVPEVIDISSSLPLLQKGTNVLAIHGLNASAADNDFLIVPELSGFTDTPDALPPGYFARPTPGTDARATALSGFVSDTKFTSTDAAFHGRGLYDHSFPLTLSTTTPGAVIYYTTDGSEPRDGSGDLPVNGTLYTAPLTISKTTTLRAAAFKSGFLSTNVDTQTYIFLDDVLVQPASPPAFPTVWGPVSADYQMDPRIVTDPLYAPGIRGDLQSLPVISLVLDNADMFGPNGIYSHSEAAGHEWERPVSVEYFDPKQAARQFHINAGVQILGSSQRTPAIRKHGFRITFKSKYGASKLEYPIYPGTNVDSFDNLSLHPGGHDGCAFNTDIPQNQPWPYGQSTYARARWIFQSQIDMGQPGVHGDFVHLYINGLYWGQFRMNESPGADYAAEHFGGSKEDYDALKHHSAIGSTGQPNQYEVIDGDDMAWKAMYALATAGLGTDAQFQAIRQYLDVDNFIDYLIVNMVSGNRDWPNKNWYATRKREPGAGFKFYCWDGEISLGLEDPNADRTGVNGAQSPGYIYSRLRGNTEFRRMFGDHIQRHLFNGGALTVESMQARFAAITGAIESSIVPESARWGDASFFHQDGSVLYTRGTHWRPEVNRVMTEIIPQRHPVTLQQFRTAGLFPSLSAPGLSQFGGSVPAGFSFSLTNSNATGAVYYTLDGTDPRVYGTGARAASAVLFSSPVEVTSPLRVRARVQNGTIWSAEIDTTFYPPQDLTKLVISEIMYHPADTLSGTEYIELQNTGTVVLDLTGVHFASGIPFTFPAATMLAPGARILVVENKQAFEAAYGAGLPIAGEYQPASLSNGGETLRLVDGLGDVIESFSFNDAPPWPAAADGGGYSLVRIAPASRLDPSLPASWRASVALKGNPGVGDATAFPGGAAEWLAYALGGNQLPSISVADGEYTYHFRRNLAADDVIFTVETSTDMTAWKSGAQNVTWLSSENNADGTDTLNFRATATGAKIFYRLRVVQRPL